MADNLRYLYPVKSPAPLHQDEQPSPVGLVLGGGPPHDGGMEARIAKLEATVAHIQTDVAEIKTGIRDMTAAWIAFKDSVNTEFKETRKEIQSESWKLIGAGGAAFIIILGAMATGFKWI